jgi:hypothetical protein
MLQNFKEKILLDLGAICKSKKEKQCRQAFLGNNLTQLQVNDK